MKKVEFSTVIDASPREVWETMFHPESFKKWVGVSWPGCYYEGSWKEGEKLTFLSPGAWGSEVLIIVNRQYEYVLLRHVAVVKEDGTIDKSSKMAKSWIGTTLGYSFRKIKNQTQVTIEITIATEWAEAFSAGWKKALEELKRICGRREVKQ